MTLTPEVARLVDDLRSPDPAVRDQGAYRSLARLADEGRLDDHLVELGDRAVALLGDGAVQARSFGALLLALVAARDNDTGRADDASVRGWLAAFLGWYAAEPDTRGHDEEAGWLHAVAHGADAAGELAGSPRLGADDLAALLAALVDRTVAPTSTHWLQAEDDRVAYAVTAVLQRDLVDAAEIRRQVDRLAAAWLDAPGPLAPSTDNATRLAHALRLQLATGVRYSDDGELLRPAAGHAVDAALTAALAARHPFLDGKAPPGADPLEQLHALAADRERRGMRRVLRPRSLDDDVLDLASNDYLGLARDPRVAGAAAEAARRWGAGSTGSRLVTGSTDLHTRLEADLAGFVGTEAGLVFSSGYLANLGCSPRWPGPARSWCPTPSTTRPWSTPAACRGRRSRWCPTGTWQRSGGCSRGVRPDLPWSSPTRCSASTETWRRSPSCTPSPAGTVLCWSWTRRTPWAWSATRVGVPRTPPDWRGSPTWSSP